MTGLMRAAMLPIALGITFIIIGLIGRGMYIPYGIIFIVIGIFASRHAR